MLDRLLVRSTTPVMPAGPVELRSQAVGHHYVHHATDIVLRARAPNNDQAINLKNKNEIQFNSKILSGFSTQVKIRNLVLN